MDSALGDLLLGAMFIGLAVGTVTLLAKLALGQPPLKREGIACPGCGWAPSADDEWQCRPGCGARFDTFATNGCCPSCAKQWDSTACLRCQQWSARPAWFRVTPSPAREPPRVQLRRCPYCHTDVLPQRDVACAGCLAPHHTACWDEHGQCSACGSRARFAAIETTEGHQTRRDLPPPRHKERG